MGTTEATCPHCQARAEKIFSAPAIHFRGSGFYASDSKNASTSASSGMTEQKESPPKTESKAEVTPPPSSS